MGIKITRQKSRNLFVSLIYRLQKFIPVSNEPKYDVLILSHILEHRDNLAQFLLDYKNYFHFIYIQVPDFDRGYLNHYRHDLKMNMIYTDNDHVGEFNRYELSELLSSCVIGIAEAEYRYGVQKLWCQVL